MANPSFGHILIVRRQSYIPSYFSVYESQLSSNNEYSENENCQTSYSELGSGARFHWPPSETLTSQNQPHFAGYLTIPLKKMTEDSEESGTLTTRLLSSGIAKRFSCNVSKMAYRLRNRTICDGYYGCPDEKLCTEKGNAASLKRGKPVCILPWKKRNRGPKVKKNKKEARNSKASAQELDGITLSLERTKVADTNVKSHVTRCHQGIGTKCHPALFYSYYIAKGNAVQYRKIWAPKPRPCDGFFGCYEDGSISQKKAGKRKPIPKY
ncbi:uncharacterized protein [Montipora foliosa]|uniref:uncharacterized protein isoform X1 n=1 Tax=Montipora foliosa TaxID=591990 RepID=UPI0035F1AC6D